MSQSVVVVIGVGGMGESIARRLGSGARLLIADFNAEALEAVRTQLEKDGYAVTAAPVDVSSRESVCALARRAAGLGPVRTVVHTAGLSPAQASVAAILAVDLLGVALVLEEFGQVVAPGGSGVVIASMAGHRNSGLSGEEAAQLATAPADELLSLPVAAEERFSDPGAAYTFSKAANLLRVRAASSTWGARNARINSVSPGAIATPMGQAELAGEHGDTMRRMIAASNAKRAGTAADITDAVAFLVGPSASFISGTDLLVDGGVTALAAG
ncbi:SDR family oxidoreductase [Streptomyces sp. bgisy100]|uniref:SDR family oxidoreductase n=1 Tax=Streptomyces sp. bgisy100 TaxID=3413783 RepID=UPI003D755C4F